MEVHHLTHNIEQYRKEYYLKNKDTYYKQKHCCDTCGGKFVIANRSHHNNTKKHKYAVLKIQFDILKKAQTN